LKYFLVFILSFFSCSLFAQTDTSLLNEVRIKLANGTDDPSTVLTAKKWLPLHPVTAFRDLIASHAPSGSLSIAPPDEPGRKIKVIVKVQDENGTPLKNIFVYLYQTDSRGWYAAESPHVNLNEGDMRHARLFGYVKTDEQGRFDLFTVKPSGYPRSDLPAHIHIHFSAKGYRNYGTELLFDDDERLVGDIRASSIRNRFLIAKPEKAEPPLDQQFSYTVTLKKN
jgi:protocatechuate 3,4-dioxygenase beta subunit